ncbi:MAG: fimbria/pilus outer membrane usher protein [Ramlibacter sp.]
MRWTHVAVAAMLCGVQAPGACAAQAAPAMAAAPEPLVLAVTLNTEAKGQFFAARTADGDFLLKPDDLRAMGLASPGATTTLVDGEPHVSLRSIKGVSFRFQEKGVVLAISADPALLPRSTVNLGARQRRPVRVPTGNSAFFNYAITHAHDSSAATSQSDFAGEFGARMGESLLLANGNTVLGADGRRRFVRLQTSLTHDDRSQLQRRILGDFFASSRDLGNGANLGGINISRSFLLDPYVARYPLQTITGQTALPSDLEVYVDGQRIRTEKIKPGSFELRDLQGYGGARTVQVLLRDAFGRVQQLDYPLYFSDQPLQKGLADYSYSFGAMRRDYGSRSNHYGPAAYSMFHRYGLSDALTVGFRAEGRRGLYNAGPMATAVLGNFGVLNASVAASRYQGQRGLAGLIGYSYQARSWYVGASARRDSRHYAALGDPVTFTERQYDGSLSAGYTLRGLGTFSLSHAVSRNRPSLATAAAPATAEAGLNRRRETTLGFSVPLIEGKASLVANLSHINDGQARNELFVGLTFSLDGGHTAVTNYRQSAGNRFESFQLNRPAPLGEGVGYDLSLDHGHGTDGESLQARAAGQYNAPMASIRAEVGELRTRAPTPANATSYRLAVSGGVAFVGGEVAWGRPVLDSFGLVKVGGLEGIPVSVNGQDMGKTNARGQLFVPALSSFYDNQIAIAPENMPMDYAFNATVQRVSPKFRSGVLLDFDVTRVQAVTGKLFMARPDGPRPAEFLEIALTVKGQSLKLPTGRGGEFYVENLAAGSYPASVQVEGRPCRFDITVPDSTETFVDLGPLQCRTAPP